MNMTNPTINVDDVKARVDLLAAVEHDLGQGRKSGAWVLFFCPFHDNHKTPALAVNVKTQTWKCFGCDKGGDVFAWTMLREGVGFRDALQKLSGGVDLSAPPARPVTPQEPWDEPPAGAWQARGREFLAWAQKQLFSEAGEPGLAELLRRGIQVETAVAWGVGFCPNPFRDKAEKWGVDDPDGRGVYLARGLIFPSFVDGSLWRLKVRLFGEHGPVGKESQIGKYLNVPGSKKALFGANHLAGQETLLLCEGEPDALLAWQEGRYFADVMTLGGAGQRMVGRWLPYLLPYRRIVVVYDPDKAGERGAETLKLFGERVEVIRPPDGDVCEMHQRGHDVETWLVEILL